MLASWYRPRDCWLSTPCACCDTPIISSGRPAEPRVTKLGMCCATERADTGVFEESASRVPRWPDDHRRQRQPLPAGRRKRPKSVFHHRVRLAGARLVATDRGDEVAAVERVELERRARTHRGGAHRVVQERDLAEAVARTDGADEAA